MGVIVRILVWIAALIGLAIWLGGTYVLTVQSSGAMADELPRKLAALIGVPLLLIGSVLILRASGKLTDFLAGVAFAALLCVYGVGVPSSRMLDRSAHDTSAVTDDGSSSFATNETGTDATAPSASTAEPPPPIQAPATDTGPDDNVLSRGSGRGPGGAPAPSPADRPSMASPGSTTPTTTRGRSIDGDEEQTQAANTQLSSNDFTMEDLRFNKPDQMRINQPYVIEAQIGVPTAATLGTSGPRVTRSVPIPGSRMVRVELVANDFDITKLHQVDNQLLTPGSTARWMWRVTPRSASDQSQLLLQVFGVLRQQGYEGTVLIRTYEENIPVEVTPIDRFQLGAQAFLARWDIIAGLAGAIGGIWVFFTNILKALRGRREQPA